MSEIVQISDESDLQKFIREVDGFHDTLLHEAVLMHPGYVDREGRMFGDTELPNLRMLFQSQMPHIAVVELNLEGVSRFSLQPGHELRLEGEFKRSHLVLYPCGKKHSGACEIRSTKAEYRLHGKDHLGPHYFLSKIGQPEK